ncbi:hypothetical protein ABB37_10031 [Leptomonas pyrrhocoris]|uniref:Uncharacterized protein n=1 Tax=Leptomonas pyrrhocoris TaxID=157538 RepID=A0A0N1J458_LEPPY|nr:hypothetical protein ABB37_10031 [Leptomonas pyrrhocoris]XP_015651641.1 hypothetical protein ABB37_10031 [Leptomonas pyrrhocoris]KPA73201.1 hypothetical protein ABB37_10031 [Leptomonas pyrrhocoris]KPA73202.1 hypothetical protein ABB37_10031 [Leptomonas pyrrhocoris]|eukprot:XP_015651640.1 hypothetical protein ABB37_10031 [Leptomonas pyrrhocoris]
MLPTHSDSLTNSYDSSGSEGGWGEQQRGRLTAADELRGHLEDCLGLYRPRFLCPDTSAQCIQEWKASTLTESTDDGRKMIGGPPAQPPSANASASPLCGDGGEARDAFDVSTVATVLVLRDGGRGATPAAPLGVAVCFQYWTGFTPYAQRPYTSVAEAREELGRLARGEWTIAEMVRGGHGWTCLGRDADTSAPSTGTPHEGLRGAAQLAAHRAEAATCDNNCGREEEDNEEETIAYESLMSLLVHRYL